MRKILKRTLAVVLVFALAASSAVCIAAQPKKFYNYGSYVVLGDSIASGYNDITRERTAFRRIEHAYGTIVADTIGAKLVPLACPGFRTVEMRYMLEDDYETDDKYLFRNAYNIDKMNEMIPSFRKSIADAGLITLGLGGNDFGTYLTWIINDVLAKEGLCTAFVKEAQKLSEKNGWDFNMDKYIDLADKMDAVPELAAVLPGALAYGVGRFIANWDNVIEDIYALNPDVTMVVVGLYDIGVKTEEDAKKKESVLLKQSAFQTIIDLVNAPVKLNAQKYGYIYIDPLGTICDDKHPTHAGHRHIANMILEALPDANAPVETELSFKEKVEKSFNDFSEKVKNTFEPKK